MDGWDNDDLFDDLSLEDDDNYKQDGEMHDCLSDQKSDETFHSTDEMQDMNNVRKKEAEPVLQEEENGWNEEDSFDFDDNDHEKVPSTVEDPVESSTKDKVEMNPPPPSSNIPTMVDSEVALQPSVSLAKESTEQIPPADDTTSNNLLSDEFKLLKNDDDASVFHQDYDNAWGNDDDDFNFDDDQDDPGSNVDDNTKHDNKDSVSTPPRSVGFANHVKEQQGSATPINQKTHESFSAYSNAISTTAVQGEENEWEDDANDLNFDDDDDQEVEVEVPLELKQEVGDVGKQTHSKDTSENSRSQQNDELDQNDIQLNVDSNVATSSNAVPTLDEQGCISCLAEHELDFDADNITMDDNNQTSRHSGSVSAVVAGNVGWDGLDEIDDNELQINDMDRELENDGESTQAETLDTITETNTRQCMLSSAAVIGDENTWDDDDDNDLNSDDDDDDDDADQQENVKVEVPADLQRESSSRTSPAPRSVGFVEEVSVKLLQPTPTKTNESFVTATNSTTAVLGDDNEWDDDAADLALEDTQDVEVEVPSELKEEVGNTKGKVSSSNNLVSDNSYNQQNEQDDDKTLANDLVSTLNQNANKKNAVPTLDEQGHLSCLSEDELDFDDDKTNLGSVAAVVAGNVGWDGLDEIDETELKMNDMDRDLENGGDSMDADESDDFKNSKSGDESLTRPRAVSSAGDAGNENEWNNNDDDNIYFNDDEEDDDFKRIQKNVSVDVPDDLPKEKGTSSPVQPRSVGFAEEVKVIVTSPSRNLNETFISYTSTHSTTAVLGDENEWDEHAGESNAVGYKNEDVEIEVPSELKEKVGTIEKIRTMDQSQTSSNNQNKDASSRTSQNENDNTLLHEVTNHNAVSIVDEQGCLSCMSKEEFEFDDDKTIDRGSVAAVVGGNVGWDGLDEIDDNELQMNDMDRELDNGGDSVVAETLDTLTEPGAHPSAVSSAAVLGDESTWSNDYDDEEKGDNDINHEQIKVEVPEELKKPTEIHSQKMNTNSTDELVQSEEQGITKATTEPTSDCSNFILSENEKNSILISIQNEYEKSAKEMDQNYNVVGGRNIFTVKSPDGIPVQIDFDKLLELEIVKRLFIEKELEYVQSCQGELQDEKKDLEQRFDHEKANFDQSKAELESRIKFLEETNSNLKEEHKKKLSALAESNLTNDRLQDELANKNQTIDQIHSKLKENEYVMQSERKVQENTILQLNDALDSAKTKLSNLEQIKSDNELKLEQVEEELEEMSIQCAIFKRNYDDLYSESESLEKEKQNLEEKVKTSTSQSDEQVSLLQRKLDEVSAQHHHLVDELQNQISTILAEKEEVTRRNIALNDDCTKLKQQSDASVLEVETLKSELVCKKNELVTLKDSKDFSEAQCEKMKHQIALLEDEMNNLKSQIGLFSSNQEKMIKLQQNYDEAVIARTELEEQCRDLQERISTKKESESSSIIGDREVDECKRQLSNVTQERNDALSENKVLSQLNEELNMKISDLENMSREKESESSLIRDETLNLKAQISSISHERTELRSENKTLSQRCSELEDKIMYLEQEVGSLKESDFELDLALIEQERDDVVIQKDKLEIELRQSKESKIALKNELDSVLAKNKSLESQCKALETKMKNIHDSSGTSLDSLKEKGRIDRLEEENVRLLAENEKANADILRLQNEVDMAKEAQNREHIIQMEAMEMRINQIQSDLNQSVLEKEDAFSRLKIADDKLRQNVTMQSNLENNLSRKEEELSNLQQTNSQLVISIQSVKNELSTTSSALFKANNNLQTLNDSNVEMENNYQQLKDQSMKLQNDYNDVVEQRDQFETENEELYVQLGYLRQTSDENQTEYENARSEFEEKIRYLEQLNKDLESRAAHPSSSIDESEVEELHISIKNLESENVKLSTDVTTLMKANTEHRHQIASLVDDRNHLMTKIKATYAEITQQNTEDSIAKEDGPVVIMDMIVSRFSQIQQLQKDQLAQIQDISDTLKRKDEKLKDLEFQLSGRETSEFLKYERNKVGDLEQQLSKCLNDLEISKEKNSSLQVEILELQLNVNEKRKECSSMQEKDELIATLKDEKMSQEKELIELDMQKKAAEAKLETAETEIALLKEEKIIFASDTEERDCKAEELSFLQAELREKEEEITGLKGKVSKYEDSILSIQSAFDSKLEEVRVAADKWRSLLASKDEIIQNNSVDIEALDFQLQNCQAVLEGKEADVDMLSDELEKIKKELDMSKKSAAANLFEISTREEAESTEFMRQQLISLAIALEDAEKQRAEAMEKVLKERRTNAESLKKMGLLVKRFYSTLSCGES